MKKTKDTSQIQLKGGRPQLNVVTGDTFSGGIMFHKMRCKNCNRKWATNLDTLAILKNETLLKYCPSCSGFWELSIEEEDYAISGEATLGRFSPRFLLRILYRFGYDCLLIAGTIAGITVVLVGALISLLSDWIFKERK